MEKRELTNAKTFEELIDYIIDTSKDRLFSCNDEASDFVYGGIASYLDNILEASTIKMEQTDFSVKLLVKDTGLAIMSFSINYEYIHDDAFLGYFNRNQVKIGSIDYNVWCEKRFNTIQEMVEFADKEYQEYIQPSKERILKHKEHNLADYIARHFPEAKTLNDLGFTLEHLQQLIDEKKEEGDYDEYTK